MTFTDLKSLFEDKQFGLPYTETDDKKSFLFHFLKKMHHFSDVLEKLPDNAFDSYNKEIFLVDVNFIISQLEKVLTTYLNGFPAQSYLIFQSLAEYPALSPLLSHWRTITLDSNTPLFRTKKEHSYTSKNIGVNANGFKNLIRTIDLFHVPFEKRKAIGTNRFSIPGFPCLYLSGALHTSWSEALENINNSFHGAIFRNHRPIYIVDLVPVEFVAPQKMSLDKIGQIYSYNDFNDALLDYALLFPLITACHSKVSYTYLYDGEVKFKSEYIIPQLLLQWYRANDVMVDGIRYLSCTADAKFPKQIFDKFNYVLPAHEMKEEGYCSSLLRNFSGTPVYSYLESTGQSEFEVMKEITEILLSQKHSPLE